jgi:hypothetical protein
MFAARDPRSPGISLVALSACWLVSASLGRAEVPVPAEAPPPPAEVAALLQREPIGDSTWPAWRRRLLSWFNSRTRNADEAYQQARDFIKRKADPRNGLPAPYKDDFLAHYLRPCSTRPATSRRRRQRSIARKPPCGGAWS